MDRQTDRQTDTQTDRHIVEDLHCTKRLNSLFPAHIVKSRFRLTQTVPHKGYMYNIILLKIVANTGYREGPLSS